MPEFSMPQVLVKRPSKSRSTKQKVAKRTLVVPMAPTVIKSDKIKYPRKANPI